MATHQKRHREIIMTTELNPVKLCISHDCGSYVPYHYHDAYEFIYLINGTINVNSLHQQSPLSLFIAQLPSLPTEIPTQLNTSNTLDSREPTTPLTQDPSPAATSASRAATTPDAMSMVATPMQISHTCYAAQMAQDFSDIELGEANKNSNCNDNGKSSKKRNTNNASAAANSYDKNPQALQLLEDIASGQAAPLRYTKKSKAKANKTAPAENETSIAETIQASPVASVASVAPVSPVATGTAAASEPNVSDPALLTETTPVNATTATTATTTAAVATTMAATAVPAHTSATTTMAAIDPTDSATPAYVAAMQTMPAMEAPLATSPIADPEVPYAESNGALDFATGLTISPCWQTFANDKSYARDKSITYKLNPNGYNFALINSNEMHATSCPTWNNALVLQIPESFIKKLLNYPEDFPLYFNPHLASAACLKRFSDAFLRLVIVLENYQQKPSFQIHFNHALYGMLECMLEMIVTDDTISQLQALNYPIASNANLKRLQPVFEFLNHHYQEQLKLEQIAAVAHLHPSYFCQLFKDTVGMSPLNYLSELRLCHIYYDLSEQKQPISELLQRHGYSNSKKFYRHFKERFHQSPSEVRQQQTKPAAKVPTESDSPYFARI